MTDTPKINLTDYVTIVLRNGEVIHADNAGLLYDAYHDAYSITDLADTRWIRRADIDRLEYRKDRYA